MKKFSTMLTIIFCALAMENIMTRFMLIEIDQDELSEKDSKFVTKNCKSKSIKRLNF